MENCNRYNSGTVSRIHLKLGTGVDHPSCITLSDFGNTRRVGIERVICSRRVLVAF